MIIVKTGGSAITDKTLPFTPRYHVIKGVAEQVSQYTGEVIIVHGGGSYGHPLAKEYRLQRGFSNPNQVMGVAKTRLSMMELNTLVVSLLIDGGIPAVSVQPSASFICRDTRISACFLDPVRNLLNLPAVPVLYGDVVTDEAMGFCILSGDQIVSYLASVFHPDRVIFGLNTEGLYTKDPLYEDAELIQSISFSDLATISGEETGDVTRGMKGKLAEIASMAGMGVEVNLINLTKKGTLLRALRGSVEGTIITDSTGD
jgi:isopentenyl phosphate kinase